MLYRVAVLTRAWHDFRRIKSWLAKQSHSGSQKWALAFAEALIKLQSDPDRFPIIQDLQPESILIRQLLFKTKKGHTYRILFTILQDEVRVLRVRGTGQRPVRRKDLQD